ncbi:hypothetical protein GUITHDRAFT_94837, partial [Guillardia theta CCMP2712]
MGQGAMQSKRQRTSSPDWSEQVRSSFETSQGGQVDAFHAQWESAGLDSSSGLPSPSFVSSVEGHTHNDVELENSFFSAEIFPEFSLDSDSRHSNKPKRRHGWRTCTYIEGCCKAANFGDPVDGKPIFCLQHKLPMHKNVVSRKCQHVGCSKRPVFGEPFSKKPGYCREHKSAHHVDVANKRCQFPNCRRHPVFGDARVYLEQAEQVEAKFCAKHKLTHHVDVRHRRCEFQNCTKLPSFGWHNDMIPRCCSTHKKDGQVYVASRLC